MKNEIKEKLKKMDMTEEEYIKYIAVLDFHEFKKEQIEDIENITVEEYIENKVKYIDKKVKIYGEQYRTYFEEYSQSYMKKIENDVHDGIDDKKHNEIKNKLSNIIDKVNQDYAELEKIMNVSKKIKFTENEIKTLNDDFEKKAYLELLEIRHHINADIDINDIKFKF